MSESEARRLLVQVKIILPEKPNMWAGMWAGIDDVNRTTVNLFLDHCQSIIQNSQSSTIVVKKYSKLLNEYFHKLNDSPNEYGVWPEHLWDTRAAHCIERYRGKRIISQCPYCGRLALLNFMEYDFDCYACGREYNDFGSEYDRY